MPESIHRNSSRFLIAALIGLVATYLGELWMSSGFAAFSPRAYGIYALIAAYSGLAIWGDDWLKTRWGGRGLAVYFVAQAAIFVAVRELGPPYSYPWMLSLPVISQAAGYLRWPGLVVVMMFYAGHLAYSTMRLSQGRWQGAMLGLISIGAAYIFTVAFTRSARIAEEARERAAQLAAELETANACLREHAAQSAELAKLQERTRIARDIHDGLGHYLTVVAVQLQAARALLASDPRRAGEALDRAEQSSRAALDDVRRSVGALRVTQAPPLRDALAGLIAESGIDVALRVEGGVRELPEAATQVLFRAAQEGLTNVRKHSGAARAEISLDYREPKTVAVEIVDEGRGQGAGVAGGFGLVGLRERLAAVGGTLRAGNRANGGFSLRVEVPA